MPGRRRSFVARSIPASRPTRGLSRTSTRSTPSTMPRKPIFAAKPTPGGRCCGPNTMTVASQAATPTGPPCSGSWRTCGPAGSTSSWSTRVDRLTRSLADFANLVGLYDRHNVSFVSVTQQFNTITSMGRLTLNVLLSFAQFEREVTSERIRDKIAASKRKGLWVGGMAPLGYDTKDRRITVNEPEAETVRTIFRSYLKLGSLNLLMADLRKRGIVTKVRTLKTGETVGAIPFTRGPLAHLLRNRFYIGDVPFKGEILKGEQPAIVDRDLFEAVQAKLSEQVSGHKGARMKSEALLIGRIFDDHDNRISPSHARKGGVKYRYYLSSALLQGMAGAAGSVRRVPAAEIEALVVRSVREHLKPVAPIDDRSLIDTHVARVEVQPEQLVIHLARAKTPDRQRANCDHILNVRSRNTPSTRRRDMLLPVELPPQQARPTLLI